MLQGKTVLLGVSGGIADEMLSKTVAACTCKIFLAPAMNQNMLQNQIEQHNLQNIQ